MNFNNQVRLSFLILVGCSIIPTSQGSLIYGSPDPPPLSPSLNRPIIPQMCNPRSSSTPPSPFNNLPLCVLSIDDITFGRTLPGSKIQSTPMPYWFNATLARIGQTFALKNKFSVTIGALYGLLSGLPFPDARDVLAFTRNSDTLNSCTQRYVATATQVYLWIEEILNTQLNGIFFTSIANVRAMHLDFVNRINTRLANPLRDPATKYNNYAPTTDEVMWNAIDNDLASSTLGQRDYSVNYVKYDSSAVPINQFIQGLTLFGFAGYAILNPKTLFIHDATDEELNGWLHLWAIIGYVIGVDDNYNIMLQPDVATARSYFNNVQHKYVIPGFFKIDKVGKVLIESMLKAINQYLPTMGPRPIMYRLLRDYFKISAPAMLALINSDLVDYTAQLNWDTVFSPSTTIPAEHLLLNTGLSTDIQTLVIQYFGLILTNEGKAAQVYYPGLSG